MVKGQVYHRVREANDRHAARVAADQEIRAIVRDLASVYTVDTDQVALLALVQRAKAVQQ